MALYGFDHSVFKNIQSLAEIGFYFVQFRVDVIDAMELPFNERNALRILGIFLVVCFLLPLNYSIEFP